MKDPWLAVVLSCVFPGIGQIYAEQKTKGLVFILLTIGFGAALIFSIVRVLFGASFVTPIVVGLFGTALGIYVLFDSYKTAKKFNQENNASIPVVKKHPFLAVFLSLCLPGIGQIYNSQIGKAIGFMAIYFFAPAFLGILPKPFGVIAAHIIDPVIKLFILNDAYSNAVRINGGTGNIFSRFHKKMVSGVIILWFFPLIFSAGSAITIRTFFLAPYKFPTQSMSPTLHSGDKIFVNKWIYRHENPKRGDLVVFQYPLDPRKDFLKRVVGLPGEKLKIQDGHIYIDDKLLVAPEFPMDRPYFNVEDWKYGKSGMVIQIPQNSYFVLGDNSAHSADSRQWGFVPRQTIKAKAFFIWWPPNRQGKLK